MLLFLLFSYFDDNATSKAKQIYPFYETFEKGSFITPGSREKRPVPSG